MDYKEIERIFYRDGYRLAHEYLDEKSDAASLTATIRKLYEVVDELLDAFLQRTATEGNPADCKERCAWCCHQAVYAVTPEFLYINEYMKRHVESEIREKVLGKAREKLMLTSDKPFKEKMQMRIPCPFLEDGSCLVYYARPMACRIYLSSSVRACKNDYSNPGNEKYNPDLFEFPLKAGRMLNQGFVGYLKQAGFQVTELPVEQGYSSMVTLGLNMKAWIDGRSASL